MKNPWKYISYGVTAALIVAMAAATFVEKFKGTEVALQSIYHSPWFIGLWAVLAVCGLVWLVKRKVQKHVFTFAFHIALVVILAGAMVTHLSGESGQIHLIQDKENARFETDEGNEVSLPFSLRLEKFTILYHPDGKHPSDYQSLVTILPEGREELISMNHILKYKGYRFYQADYDQDLSGSILAVSRDPWGIAITYTGYILLLISMLGFFFQRGSAFKAAVHRLTDGLTPGKKRLVALIPIVFVCLIPAFWFLLTGTIGKHWKMIPVLATPLLPVHVLSMMLSYTLLLATAVIGIIGLLANNKKKYVDVSLMTLYPAVFLLAFGIFIGAVWANISWGNYWGWDPKETWALITLLVYSFAIHGNAMGLFKKPWQYHLFVILAIFAVVITYFGVNLILGGIHSYA